MPPSGKGKCTVSFYGPNSKGGKVESAGKIIVGSTSSVRSMTTQELKDEVVAVIGKKGLEGVSVSSLLYEGGEFAVKNGQVEIIACPPKITLIGAVPEKVIFASTHTQRSMTTQELKDEVLLLIEQNNLSEPLISCIEYEGGTFVFENGQLKIKKDPPKIILTDWTPWD